MNGRAWVIVVGSMILVLILALLVALGSKVGSFPEPTDLSTDTSAAMLALVGAAAIDIERIIEMLWTTLGQTTGNQRWPLNVVGAEVSRLVSDMNEDLKPFLQKVQEGIDEAGGAAAASRGIGFLEGAFPELQRHAQRFNEAVGEADELLNQVNDNPARRLISILVGSFLGLLVAGILGLDLMGATLGENPWGIGDNQPWWDNAFPNLGAAVTGLVMGLGATPTHELIKMLQETKKNRKAENNAS
jgi:hypothetical protein